MNIYKMLKMLLAKGFATKAEKADFVLKVKELDVEEQEVLADKVEAVEALPEEEADKVEETKAMLKTLMGESVGDLKKEVKEWLSSQKEASEKQAGIYAKDSEPARKQLNKKFKNFVSAIYGDEAKLKEMTTDASGTPFAGYVVDTELSMEIRHLVTEFGVARREMTNLTLSKGSYKANKLVTDVVVYWVDEGTVIGSTQAVLGQKTLELKKLGAIATLTSELLEDEEIDLFAFLGTRVAEKFAEAEDKAFFVGNGTATFGGFTGILNDAGVETVLMGAGKAFADLTADELLSLQDAIPAGNQANAKYVFHRTILSVIRKLKVDGSYIYQAPSASLPATIWNKPYVLSEVFPAISDSAVSKAFVLYGDLRSACILGTSGGMEAKRFDAGMVRNVAGSADINLITTDREAVRWIERVGYVSVMPEVIAVLKSGVTAGGE
jgi:HK97 family phage major capsid protein